MINFSVSRPPHIDYLIDLFEKKKNNSVRSAFAKFGVRGRRFPEFLPFQGHCSIFTPM